MNAANATELDTHLKIEKWLKQNILLEKEPTADPKLDGYTLKIQTYSGKERQ